MLNLEVSTHVGKMVLLGSQPLDHPRDLLTSHLNAVVGWGPFFEDIELSTVQILLLFLF